MVWNTTGFGTPNVHVVMRCSEAVRAAQQVGGNELIDMIFHAYHDLSRSDSIVAGIEDFISGGRNGHEARAVEVPAVPANLQNSGRGHSHA